MTRTKGTSDTVFLREERKRLRVQEQEYIYSPTTTQYWIPCLFILFFRSPRFKKPF
jgi:hypothetical protein